MGLVLGYQYAVFKSLYNRFKGEKDEDFGDEPTRDIAQLV